MPQQSERARVTVVSSVHRWNDTRIFVKQCGSLAAAGYHVVLAAICERSAPFDASGVRVIPLRPRRRSLRWLTWLSIVRIALSERDSVVHAHDPELVSVLLLLRLVGRKVVFDVHENIAQQVLEKEWIATFWRRPLSRVVAAALRWLPRMADAVILAEDSYLRDFPPLPNVTVIHNFPLTPRRYKHEYNSDRLRLIYVGDVRKVRGVIEYVSILARLRELGVPAELRIVGSFAARHEEDETQRMVRRLQLESSVRFLGRRPPEEIAELILDCDVGLALLHPIGNYRESYPTKMFEYMAVGLPVVASRFPLWERVLVDNDCGSVVDPLNVEEGTAAVHNYWVSGELRERHGRNGRLAALTQYSWQREALRLLAVYSTLTDPGNLRSG